MEGIVKAFFGVQVLKGVDFDLLPGEVHVLLGENGAGKSTLMKILSGAYTLDQGTVTLAGQKLDLTNYDPRRAEDLGIVTIYQNFHLIPHLSVAENISLGAFTRGRGLIQWAEVHAHAREVLEGLEFDIDPRVRVIDLSVSQKQMLEIAIAVSKNARVLIMDEPTAALSRKETETLFKTIDDIKARGIGIIYISHKLEEVKLVGDRITVLRDGAEIATLPAKSADLNHVISLMIGKSLERQSRAAGGTSGPELFRVEDLSGAVLPTPISFSACAGEILGITGLVGSGKTELARTLFGVEHRAGGTLSLHGRPITIDSPRTAVQLGVGYLPEDRDSDGLCLNLSVQENLSLALLSKLKTFFFSAARDRRLAADQVSSLGIRTSSIGQKVKYLSGGNKQKVVFGKWLSGGCDLLILDEPTIGIDVGARGDIYKLIRAFVSDGKRTVIFISSDMDEILEIADRILVMSGRTIVADLDPKTTSKQEIMQYSLRINHLPAAQAAG
jgi:ribose transport system ATP-binding protein